MQNSLRHLSTPRMAAALSLMQLYDGRMSRATCVGRWLDYLFEFEILVVVSIHLG